eukprot:983975-Amphidinium_carterae.1
MLSIQMYFLRQRAPFKSYIRVNVSNREPYTHQNSKLKTGICYREAFRVKGDMLPAQLYRGDSYDCQGACSSAALHLRAQRTS